MSSWRGQDLEKTKNLWYAVCFPCYVYMKHVESVYEIA